MSNIVQFLDSLGGHAGSSRLTDASYAGCVAAADFDADARQALMARDADRLRKLLGGRSEMRCYIVTPDE